MEHIASIDIGPVSGRKRLDVGRLPYATILTPGVFLLQPYSRGASLENVLFIEDEINVLIDTGLDYEQMVELHDSVDLVVNSHFHVGHMGKNYLFERIWAHEDEADCIEDFASNLSAYGIRGGPVGERFRGYLEKIRSGPGGPVAKRFKSDDVLSFGRTCWQVLLTPGHSPAHCCFYEPNLKVLYAGDITMGKFGPHYGAAGGEMRAYRRSIEQLMRLDVRVLATSYRAPIFDDIPGRFQRFYDYFAKRDERLLELLREPRTLEDFVRAMPIHGTFHNDTWDPKLVLSAERQMVEQHLTELVQTGRIKLEDGLYRRA